MNLAELQLSIFDTLGLGTAAGTEDRRRITRHLNTAHREMLTKKNIAKYRFATLPFTCVALSPYAVLPQAAVRILGITDRTNRRPLDEVSIGDIRQRNPGNDFTNIPYGYTAVNPSAPVALDPSAAAELFVISTAAGDGTGISAFVEGTITDGYYRRAQIAMNGLTAVSLNTAITTWVHITKFYVGGAATGTITLHQTSGVGTELARIQPGRSYARYTKIELVDIPSSAITYYADVELHVDDMISPFDEPLIPEDFHWVLEANALWKEYKKREKWAAAKDERDRYFDGRAELQVYAAKPGNYGINAHGARQFSQLGANYPAGS